MSKDCRNCRHFQWLPKPWSADQREAVWSCKLGKDEKILDEMDTHISGVTWIGDTGRNTDLQCKLTARKCDSYEGKSCSQCKHFWLPIPEQLKEDVGYGPLDSDWGCNIHMVEWIDEESGIEPSWMDCDFSTSQQEQRYFAKRCEEYNDGSV